MKTHIKITGRAQPVPTAPLAALALLALMAVATPRTAEAQSVYWTARDLLADFFPRSEHVSYRQFDLAGDPATRREVEHRLGYSLPRARYTVYVATTAGHLDGYALFDDEPGQHLPISFAVKLSPAGVVERQEIVAYREARGDEVRDPRFRAQFVGKGVNAPLLPGDDVVAVSGATISSRAMAAGVKRALVLLDALVLHGQRSGPATARR